MFSINVFEMNNFTYFNKIDYKALNEIDSTKGMQMPVNIMHSFIAKS